MKNLILIDTSVLIRGQRNQEFLQKIKKLEPRLILSKISACELVYGSRDKVEKRENLRLVNFLPHVEVNEKISLRTFQIIDKYALKVKFGILDALIGATALEYQLSLWTENKKHFRMIEGLKFFEVE